jgi:hypothetical protein
MNLLAAWIMCSVSFIFGFIICSLVGDKSNGD